MSAVLNEAGVKPALRLRPGVNHTPIRNGIRFQHWDVTFRVQGHPALHALFVSLLPQLQQGQDPEALLRRLPASARGAARLLLGELGRRGLLVTTAGRPSPEELGAHAALYTFLESLSDDPPAAFRALRQAEVQLSGDPGLGNALRAHLGELGLDIRQGGWSPGAITVHLGVPDGDAPAWTPQFLALVGADRAVLAPQHTSWDELHAALRLPLGNGVRVLGPAEELFCGLVALDVMRAVAGLGGVSDRGQALVFSADTLQSAPVPVALRRHREDEWLHAARQAETATASEAWAGRLQPLCGDAFGLIPDPGADLEQIPLFVAGPAGQPDSQGWGVDGQSARVRAMERGLLARLPQGPVGPAVPVLGGAVHAGGVAHAVLGSSWEDVVLRGLGAHLQAASGQAPEGWRRDSTEPRDLPLEHLWLYKTLGMVYGLDVRVWTLQHPSVPILRGAAVYTGGVRRSAAFAADPAEAVGAALLGAVAAEQLGVPELSGRPELWPVAPSELNAVLHTLAAGGLQLSVAPDTTLAGTVQQGVFAGWVIASA